VKLTFGDLELLVDGLGSEADVPLGAAPVIRHRYRAYPDPEMRVRVVDTFRARAVHPVVVDGAEQQRCCIESVDIRGGRSRFERPTVTITFREIFVIENAQASE
jgi:hypothetical protein